MLRFQLLSVIGLALMPGSDGMARAQTIRDFLSAAVVVTATAVDPAGNIYEAGYYSGTFQPGGIVQPGFDVGKQDAFVAKFTPDGRQLLYATHFGGSSGDGAQALAVDTSGNAYVAGYTYSADFPVTPGAFQSSHLSPLPPDPNVTIYPGGDVFVAKIDTGGTLSYAAVLGGSGTDFPQAIAIDSKGNSFVAGYTNSPDFPVGTSAYLPQSFYPLDSNFVAKLNATGTALLYSTYFDRVEIAAIAVDSLGNSYLTGTVFGPALNVTAGAAQPVFGGGSDAFVSSLNADGTALRYATYLGGSSEESAYRIQVDSAGEAWVAGQTWSTDLPLNHAIQTQLAGRTCPNLDPHAGPYTAAPCGDTLIAKIGAGGDRFLFSSYLGGTGSDSALDLAVDGAGNAAVLMHTTSSFPLTPDALLKGACTLPLPLSGPPQGTLSFVRVNPAGTLLYSSFVAAPAFLTPAGSARTWVGSSLVDIANPGPKRLACVLNAASAGAFVSSPLLLDYSRVTHYSGIVAPGEIVSLFGWGIGPEQGAIATVDAGGLLPKQLSGVQVLFDGIPAPILYAQSGQINAVVPYSLNGATTTSVSVSNGGIATDPLPLLIDATAPAVFALDSSGIGPAVVLNQDGSLNSSANPAARGSVVQIFATGAGQSNPPGLDGQINPLAPGTIALPVRVRFTEPIDAELEYAGPAPTLVSGVIQINALIPPETIPGDRVPISLSIGSSLDAGAVTIAVK